MKKIFILTAFAFCLGTINAQTLDRSIRPSAAPAKEIEIKDAKTFTLANGLKVFVVEDHRAPIVYYSVRLDVKPALEGNKAGLESMYTAVAGNATKTRTKEQINRESDLIGAQIGSSSRSAYGRVLKKYESKMVDLMSDILLNPVFMEDELNLQLDKARSGLKMLGDDAGAMAERVSGALTYGQNFPYGEFETLESLDNIKTQDLDKFHATYFAPNVARLVIVGDVTEKEAKEMAEKYFGKWAKKTVPSATFTAPQAPAQDKVAFIEKAGVPQSAIDVSYPITYKVGTPDEMAVRVMMYIFGGGSTSRLFQNLRETHSYTYGVYASLSSDELIGRFSLSSGRGAAQVKAASTDSAIFFIEEEMNRMMNTPITADELQAAKAYMAGNFGRQLAEPATIANFAVSIDKYKLPKDYYKTYLKRLNAVTVADVQAAAKKYLKPNNAWIVVAGDKSLADGLKQFAGDKTVQFYDLNANPIAAPAVQTTSATPETVINKFVEALGGKAAIDKVNDFKIVGEMSMMGQKMDMTQAFKKPNKSLTSIGANGMVMQKIAFNGTSLKMTSPQGNQEIKEGDEFESIKAAAAVCPEMNYAANGYKMTVKGIEKVNGSDAYVVEVVQGKVTSTNYFDVASGLKVKTETTMDTPQGPMQQTEEFGDYRAVSGVKFPYTMKQSVSGMTMEMKVSTAEVNTNLADSLFE